MPYARRKVSRIEKKAMDRLRDAFEDGCPPEEPEE